MLKDLNEFIEILSNLSDKFRKIKESDKPLFADYFLDISKCLYCCAKKIENGEEIHGERGQLKRFSHNFQDKVGNVIGEQDAEKLSARLKEFAKKELKKDDIKDLKDNAGYIEAFSKEILLPIDSDHSSEYRRKFLLMSSLIALTGLAYSNREKLSSQLKKGVGAADKTLFPNIEWKMQTFLNDKLKETILYEAPEQVCQLIRDMTGGRFNIKLDRGTGKALKTDNILSSVSNNTIQCGYSGIYYDDKRNKALYFGCAIPFGLNPQEQTAWLHYVKNDDGFDDELGLKLTYIQSLYQRVGLNIIPFPAGATGSQMGGWFKRKVEFKKDLVGQTIRIPGLGAGIFRNIGMKIFNDPDFNAAANPTLSITEAIEQLKKDKILAIEWTSPHDDSKLGLDKAAGFYYSPGWWEPSTTFDVQVNIDAWKKLPKNYKIIFELACRETYTNILTEYDIKNGVALEELKKDKNIEFCNFTDEIIKEAHKETLKLLENLADGDDKSSVVFKEAYDEWKQFKNKIRAWSDLTRMDNYSEKA